MSDSEQTRADLEAEVDDLRERVERLEVLIEDDAGSVEDVPDLPTFIVDADPSTHTERALLVAFYLEEYEGKTAFTTADIEEGYAEGRMQTPANLSDTLAGCTDREWMLEVGEDDETQAKRRRLTNDGVAAAEELIDGA